MPRKKRDFEKAVSCLLSPNNYEYMLYIQSQIRKDPRRLSSPGFVKPQDVIRMVHAGNPSATPADSGDALRVLREAVRRLK